MVTVYKTAHRAILASMDDGSETCCKATQANVDQLVHECDRWVEDSRFVRFFSDIHGWSIAVPKVEGITLL